MRVSGQSGVIEDIISGKEVKFLGGQVVEWTICMVVDVTKNVDRNSGRNS